MGARRQAVEAERERESRHQAGRNEPAGAAGPKTTAETSQRDGNMSSINLIL